MFEPFRRAGIQVNFYNVNCVNGMSIDAPHKADVLLWCNYFGFRSVMPQFDGVIIEDITHSFFSDVPCHQRSDFLVASLRKWEPIYCGGYCSVQADGKLPLDEFISNKSDAMRKKREYLNDCDEKKKAEYLSQFHSSNSWLSKNYSGLLIDRYSRTFLDSVNMQKEKITRRRNAHILYEGLVGKFEFLFQEETMDCPLFVPVVIRNGKRDAVREKLTENGIYCPVHWPHPDAECESNLYDIELFAEGQVDYG